MYTGVSTGPKRSGSHRAANVRRMVGGSLAAGGKLTAERTSFNSEVRGLPFMFRDTDSRIIVEASGRILWLSDGASELGKDNACISLEGGVLSGRTRHTEWLLKKLLADAETSSEPVDQLLASAANDVPELFIRARVCSERAASVIAPAQMAASGSEARSG